jgi:hypothetical protein
MEKIPVLFLQLEIIPNCPPHMGMCLFIDDLQKMGIDCDPYLVRSEYLEHVLSLIEQKNYRLICLDSIFTIDLIRLLQEQFPHIPVLVGGVNSFSLLTHTDIKYAVFGPGRNAIRAFVDQYFGSRDFTQVPNLFFKQGDLISYSGRTEHWNLERELFPYLPFLDWNYIGPDRSPSANFTDVSIVAGTGCTYASGTHSFCHFDIEKTIRELGYSISDQASQRLQEVFNRKFHGCSFCIHQYQEFTAFPSEKTSELLLRQARYLHKTYGVTSFQVQTENPLPFLPAFLHSMLREKIPLQKISIRTRPDLLMRHEKTLLQSLDLAQERDFHLSIEQIGFESFFNDDLEVFNKNIDAGFNRNALGFLRELKNAYGDHVSTDIGHGIILFHPWSTLESIAENVKLFLQYTDIFPNFFAGRLILYSEFLPIYPKIQEEGLAVKSEHMYGLGFTMKDPLAAKAYELYEILHQHFGGSIPVRSFMDCLDLIHDHSVDAILARVFHLFPVDDR